MNADIIPFLPRAERNRYRAPSVAPAQPFRSPSRPDDLVMDHADVPSCEEKPCHCEPPGRRKAPPDDRLCEAIHSFAEIKTGLLRHFVPRHDDPE